RGARQPRHLARRRALRDGTAAGRPPPARARGLVRQPRANEARVAEDGDEDPHGPGALAPGAPDRVPAASARHPAGRGPGPRVTTRPAPATVLYLANAA